MALLFSFSTAALDKYGKPLWTKLLKLPHSVPISSRSNSIPKTHIKLHIKLHTKFHTSNSIPNIYYTITPYQTQDQKPISNSRSKTYIKHKVNNPYQTYDQKHIKLKIKNPYQTSKTLSSSGSIIHIKVKISNY